MMLSVKINKLICKIALIVIVFASFAPSISHALNALSGRNFTQDVCTSDGRKVSIQVITTKGRQLLTEFDIKPSKSDHQGLEHHLEHCPFCANPQVVNFLPSTHKLIFQVLEAEAQTIAQHSFVAVASQPYTTPPSQAPPQS